MNQLFSISKGDSPQDIAAFFDELRRIRSGEAAPAPRAPGASAGFHHDGVVVSDDPSLLVSGAKKP